MATLGIRRGEACALRWEDFDFENRTVHIRRAVCKGRNETKIKEPKSGEARRLPVGRELVDQCEPFRRAEGFLFEGFHIGYWKGGNPADKCWHPDFAGHRFRELRDSLGFDAYTLHSLRHFVAVQLLVLGKPVTQVAKFLGHANPSITQDLYANHIHDDALRDVGETASQLAGVR